MEFLDSQTSKYPEHGETYQRLGDLYSSKLWHELTEEISDLVLTKNFGKDRNLIDLYESFICKFEGKMNQLKLVQIVSVIARQYVPSKPMVEREVEEAIGFLQVFVEKRGRLGEEAYLVGEMAIAELLVQLGGEDNMKKARKMLDEAQPSVQSLSGSGAETVVNSSFFRVSCEYYKSAGPADEFYKACIQFLAYTPQETLDEKVQKQLATDMCLAALVGESVFNFGEVLSQSILSVLDDSGSKWLHTMLQVFSSGDIDKFSALCAENKQAITEQPILAQNMELIRQKIALLRLMQIVFVRPPEDRIISLKFVAQETRLDIDQAEWLLMRAMSKELIKGKIDQVDQVVHISWLKPRVLDRLQLATLKDKLHLWKENVDKTLLFIESETPELFQ